MIARCFRVISWCLIVPMLVLAAFATSLLVAPPTPEQSELIVKGMAWIAGILMWVIVVAACIFLVRAAR